MAAKKPFIELQFPDAFMFAAAMEDPDQLIQFLTYVDDASYAFTEQAGPLVKKIASRITNIKRDHGMEVQYMLFSEMLHDERTEGRTEERERLFHLMEQMENGGDAGKIPLLRKSPDLLQQMYHKYHMDT